MPPKGSAFNDLVYSENPSSALIISSYFSHLLRWHLQALSPGSNPLDEEMLSNKETDPLIFKGSWIMRYQSVFLKGF